MLAETTSNKSETAEMLMPVMPVQERRVPPEQLYWSVLDVPSGVRVRPGPLPIGFRSAFEEDVPDCVAGRDGVELSSDEAQLHIVCVPIGTGRLVACGGMIAELRAAAGSGLVLTPRELPEFIRREYEVGVDTAAVALSMNLLVGALEPPVMRAARNRQIALVLVSMLLMAAMVVIGLDRRMRSDRVLTESLSEQAESAATDFGQRIGSATRVTPQMLPSVLAITQRAADTAMRVEAPRDATAVLAQVLKQWPSSASTDGGGGQRWTCSVQSLSVGADSVTMTLVLQGDSSAFLRAMSTPDGLVMNEPRLTSIGRGSDDRAGSSEGERPAVARTRIVIRMRRTADQDVAAAGGGQS